MRLLILLCAILVIVGPLAVDASAQPAPASVTVRDTQLPPASLAGADAAQSFEALKFRANFQLLLTAIVTIFGFLSLALVAWVFRKSIPAEIEKVVRLFIVVIVVSAALILITGGYSNEQIAPAFGLFGTIVGYILGSSGRRPDEKPGEAQTRTGE
jgi:hypothetical protein